MSEPELEGNEELYSMVFKEGKDFEDKLKRLEDGGNGTSGHKPITMKDFNS